MWLRLKNVEKKKKKIVLSSSLRIPDSYLPLKNPRCLSPQGLPDFLSTCRELILSLTFVHIAFGPVFW